MYLLFQKVFQRQVVLDVVVGGEIETPGQLIPGLFVFTHTLQVTFTIISKYYTGDVMAVQNRLKYWRQQLQMTQGEFAGFIGYTQSNISHWERGRALSAVNAYKIMKKLKNMFPEIHMEDLYEEINNPT